MNSESDLKVSPALKLMPTQKRSRIQEYDASSDPFEQFYSAARRQNLGMIRAGNQGRQSEQVVENLPAAVRTIAVIEAPDSNEEMVEIISRHEFVESHGIASDIQPVQHEEEKEPIEELMESNEPNVFETISNQEHNKRFLQTIIKGLLMLNNMINTPGEQNNEG